MLCNHQLSRYLRQDVSACQDHSALIMGFVFCTWFQWSLGIWTVEACRVETDLSTIQNHLFWGWREIADTLNADDSGLILGTTKSSTYLGLSPALLGVPLIYPKERKPTIDLKKPHACVSEANNRSVGLAILSHSQDYFYHLRSYACCLIVYLKYMSIQVNKEPVFTRGTCKHYLLPQKPSRIPGR